MKWNNIKITIFKELRGIRRDKQSLHKLIIYPLLIPLIILLFGGLFDTVNESIYYVGTNYQLTKEENTIIKELSNNLQMRIKEKIKESLDLEVKNIDIRIKNVVAPKEESISE